MTLLYIDPSALIRAYLPDEPEHAYIRSMLLEGAYATMTCEIARVELASAVRAAGRAGRLIAWQRVLDGIDAEIGPGGRIKLVALRSDPIFASARRLLLDHKLRTLDAIHLAVALEDGRSVAAGDDLVFVTRDADQAAAASALGLTVR